MYTDILLPAFIDIVRVESHVSLTSIRYKVHSVVLLNQGEAVIEHAW